MVLLEAFNIPVCYTLKTFFPVVKKCTIKGHLNKLSGLVVALNEDLRNCYPFLAIIANTLCNLKKLLLTKYNHDSDKSQSNLILLFQATDLKQ